MTYSQQEIQDINDHLSQDLVLRDLISINSHIPTEYSEDVYNYLLKAIVSQQLSTKVAQVIYNRFLELFNDKNPQPTILSNMDHQVLRSVGLSNQKAKYLVNVANFFLVHDLQNTAWSQLADNEIVETLTKIKGVGVWTAQMVLMFPLCRRDVFPIGDLGIRNAISSLYHIEGKGKEVMKEMTTIAENWRPFRSMACFYLWDSLS